MEEHVKLVRKVLQKLLEAHLFAKLSKCNFHKEHIDYLGYWILHQGIEMDPAKVRDVIGWEAPKMQWQLQSFLGLANFYHQFILNFAQVALLLTDLLKTKGKDKAKASKPRAPLAWSRECQEAFEELKHLFMAERILKHPDPDKPFVIQADTSTVSVGASCCKKWNQGSYTCVPTFCGSSQRRRGTATGQDFVPIPKLPQESTQTDNYTSSE
ncbi:uncharacterized protein LOC107326551 [Python bivittatus]|uniref:Uncharacterized protein LOC107326551 n=1 Tax=Python bivittatus TaxID=176946 RepID=A0A9F3QUT1_PYTBI|nr:uncharacterized protein LOC107326551 [Python bivittatus]